MNELGTSSYSAFNMGMGIPIGTSVSIPTWMPGIDYVTALKPVGIFGRPEYREEFPYSIAYKARLDGRAAEIRADLEKLSAKYPGQTLVLLCWCDLDKEWCHRRMAAEWLATKDLVVPELSVFRGHHEPPKAHIPPLF